MLRVRGWVGGGLRERGRERERHEEREREREGGGERRREGGRERDAHGVRAHMLSLSLSLSLSHTHTHTRTHQSTYTHKQAKQIWLSVWRDGGGVGGGSYDISPADLLVATHASHACDASHASLFSHFICVLLTVIVLSVEVGQQCCSWLN